ncbi:hypothetical protein [Cronobacter phage JC01]|uniref:Uncharacterized protein n=1 Tax=Cronobacter phage JC01 TaxID=2729575 RepID=A0A6M3YKN1_9CAUD|nr:hypothetical protein JT331_gp53 [Cronobacter phage JC01]QJI52278.1 hypothetical protein [Cronobacter phage JC01]
MTKLIQTGQLVVTDAPKFPRILAVELVNGDQVVARCSQKDKLEILCSDDVSVVDERYAAILLALVKPESGAACRDYIRDAADALYQAGFSAGGVFPGTTLVTSIVNRAVTNSIGIHVNEKDYGRLSEEGMREVIKTANEFREEVQPEIQEPEPRRIPPKRKADGVGF